VESPSVNAIAAGLNVVQDQVLWMIQSTSEQHQGYRNKGKKCLPRDELLSAHFWMGTYNPETRAKTKPRRHPIIPPTNDNVFEF